MIKLALSDLDNTLLPFGFDRVTKRTVRALCSCQDQGVSVGPASGRDLSGMAKFFDNNERCYHTGVLVNGQRVYHQGNLIFGTNLDQQALQRAAQVVAMRPGCAFIVYREDGFGDWVGEPQEKLSFMYERSFIAGGRRHDALPSYPCAKAGIICMGDADETSALQDELERACPEFIYPCTVEHWLDISPRSWNKVDGIKVLMNTLGIGLDEVCVIGDA
ncbi:MAG: HAD family hydrolase, partial [Coriobacteriales bacterium]|nr:HAD family hydrolase [Coriobacteriales bacterium]